MAKNVIHVSEAEATSDFSSLLAKVGAGAKVIIEDDARSVAVASAAQPRGRFVSECIEMLPEDSTATVGADFAGDVEAAIESRREPLGP